MPLARTGSVPLRRGGSLASQARWAFTALVLVGIIHFKYAPSSSGCARCEGVAMARPLESTPTPTPETTHGFHLRAAEETPKPRSQGREAPWLLLFFPTVPRKNHEDYLIQTLKSWAPSIVPGDRTLDPLAGKVHLAIISNREGHKIFDAARAEYESAEMHFHQRSYPAKDPAPDSPAPVDPVNQPNAGIRKQSFDVAEGIRIALRLAAGMPPEEKALPPLDRLPAFFGFFEDDFELCPNGFHAIVHAIRKTWSYCPSCSAVRVSTGLNGIIIRGTNASSLADYIDRHTTRRPPDHLVSEWYLAEKPDAMLLPDGRAGNVAYRYNVLKHLGVQSAVKPDRGNGERETPQCWTPLSWMLFEKEHFHPSECGHDDLWPCKWDYESAEAAAAGPPPPHDPDEKKRRFPGIRPSHLDPRPLPLIQFAPPRPATL